MSKPAFNPTSEQCSVFATTHWSVVLAAGQNRSEAAGTALEQLCRTYWHPLYAYLRRRGYGEHDAQDLTQGFLAHLLERQAIAGVAREKGKFRSFLLASLNYFLADERDRANAQKRGGGRELISLDLHEAESRYAMESAADDCTPEKLYERRWAITLLDSVLGRLAREFGDAGKGELFGHLQGFLVQGTGGKSYREIGLQTGLSEEAIKKAVQRMRQRYHDLFRQQIAQTVATAADVDEELRHLCDVLST